MNHVGVEVIRKQWDQLAVATTVDVCDEDPLSGVTAAFRRVETRWGSAATIGDSRMTRYRSRVPLDIVLAMAAVLLTATLELRASEEASDKLHAFIDQGIQDWAVTGLAIAVVKNDRVVFSRGYGVRDIRTGSSVDENTAFQIGSCSKPLTASALALLVQDQEIQWDTPVVETWPGFRVADPVVTKQATLRDILCHRTGVGKDESVLYYEMPLSRAELLRRLPEVKQAAPFRTELRYSNLMYTAVDRVIEQVTGKGWDEHMSQRLFKPLGMTRTYTSMRALAQIDNVAVPHVRVDDETLVTAFADQDNIGPAASLCSSASDLSRWLLMMVNEGRIADRQILPPDLVREMYRPHILAPFPDPVHGEHIFNAYGLGLMLSDYHGRRIAKHSGMSGHSMAMIGFVPEKRVGAVVLANQRPSLFHYAAFRRALDLYCGMPPIDIDRANKKLLAEHLARQADSLKRRIAARDPGKRATLSLEEYRGKYQGKYDLLATLEIDAGGLVLRYGNFVADVTHWHDDTFRARLRQRRLAHEQDWWLTFSVVDGAVAKLHIHSEHDVHADFVPVAPPAAAQKPLVDAYATAIQSLLQDKFAESNAGMVIGLIDDSGSRVFSAGRLDNGTDQEVDGETIFEIGSVTKVFTSLLLLDAVRRGEMKLDDPVADHLPAQVKMPVHGGKEITLLNLAVQDSGLPFHPDNLADTPVQSLTLREIKEGGDAYTVENMYAFLSGHKLTNGPGTSFEYSNVGMALLGHAIERKTGTDYESLVVDRICRPLKMDDTRITLSPALKARLARGHLDDGRPSEHWHLQAMAPSGSLLSTASDLLTFLSANLGFTHTHLTPLMEKMLVVRHTGSPIFGKTAMPWVDQGVYNPPGSELWGHSGGGYGTIAFVALDKKRRRGVVVLTNQMKVHPNGIGWTILQGMPLTRENISFAVREVVGIGIALDTDEKTGMPRITTVYPKSPAGQAGLSAGLVIQKIDGMSVKGKTLKECLGMLAGPAGARVRLELFDPQKKETRTVELARQKFLTTLT